MKIEYSETSVKQLSKLPKSEIKKIVRKIKSLEDDQTIGKKLQGEFSDKYSLRAWPYRIIYQVDKKQKTIYIVIVEHRQSVYR